MMSMFESIRDNHQKYLRQGLEFAFGVSYIYFMWITAHYVAAHMYARWCVPATIVGFITAPFLVPAPHCQALRWTIYTGGEKIFAMWVVIGSWMFIKINLNDYNK